MILESSMAEGSGEAAGKPGRGGLKAKRKLDGGILKAERKPDGGILKAGKERENQPAGKDKEAGDLIARTITKI